MSRVHLYATRQNANQCLEEGQGPGEVGAERTGKGGIQKIWGDDNVCVVAAVAILRSGSTSELTKSYCLKEEKQTKDGNSVLPTALWRADGSAKHCTYSMHKI